MQLRRPLGNERGIALPLVLLALVLMSVVTTGVLLTSTTEVALSVAHQDATRNLYIAEAAAQSFVAREPITGPRVLTYQPPMRPADEAVKLTIERMLNTRMGSGTSPDSTAIYALTASPAKGGRAVTTQLQIDRLMMQSFDADISAALTCDSCDAGGGAQISNGSDGLYCNPADSVANAVLHANGGNFESGGSSVVKGTVEESNLGAEAMFQAVLGASIRDFAFAADIKFGSIFNEPGYTGTTVSSIMKIQGRTVPALRGRFNWGCPGQMDLKDQCFRAPNMDTTYAPIVAIDAQGGKVVLNGDHGQGILIVINGDLHINGTFSYRGIIVAEGNMKINGSGGNQGGAKIEGAVITAGALEFEEASTTSNGNSVVRYNKCAVDLATNSFNKKPNRYGAPTVRGRTFGWTEVVR